MSGRIDNICSHPLWQRCAAEICRLEQDRPFCRHNLAHFLDVARIAQIRNLESSLHIPKELIYAAALLHDIGRHQQYSRGVPHELASAELAKVILEDCGFLPQEVQAILQAITGHRRAGHSQDEPLTDLLFWADKKSRACWACPAAQECNWSSSRRNLTLDV